MAEYPRINLQEPARPRARKRGRFTKRSKAGVWVPGAVRLMSLKLPHLFVVMPIKIPLVLGR